MIIEAHKYFTLLRRPLSNLLRTLHVPIINLWYLKTYLLDGVTKANLKSYFEIHAHPYAPEFSFAIFYLHFE
jgi:hypothetical protein